MKQNIRQSRTRHSRWLVVAALALALALSPAAAIPNQDVGSGQDPYKKVAQSFSQLDGQMASKGCVQASTVLHLDALLIELGEWDLRTVLNDTTRYPVCGINT